jgi:L-alanine-DL-glutamate epimerase-like enolase superfamily enzyme
LPALKILPVWNAMKITSIETIALRDASVGSTTVVRVHTDEGITGIGQAESPSLVIDALIRCNGGIADLICNEDPTQVERLWQKMYAGTGLWGRRGVALSAIGAVETALWDIAGKAAGKPVCELIWRGFATTREPAEIKTKVTPYATVYPPGDTLDEMRRRVQDAVALGFQAVKIEEWPGGFAHVDLATDVAIAGTAREVLGPHRALMFDIQNKWQDVATALATINAIAPYRPYFIEAPLPPDNLDAYARLADATDMRIAAGDWGFAGRFEFADLLEHGHVDVVQPSSVRSGGISEMIHIAEMAYRKGALCVPHAWSHMIGTAACVHVAAVVPNMPFFEFGIPHPASAMVSDLLTPALMVNADGTIDVPRRPGLGFELNEKTVEKHRVPLH